MNFIAIVIGKTIFFGLKITGRRGATLPGLVVERWFPKFLPHMLDKLSDGVLIVTGTNGKTTTTKMLASIVGGSERVLTNPTGSNFTRGIVSTIIQNCQLSGKLPYDIAILELDEAYAAKFVEIYHPRGTLVLNVMRDQLDRFAEIDFTAQLITKVVKKTSEFVVLNSDDPRVAAMANQTNVAVYFYAVSPSLRDIFKNDDEHHGPVSVRQNNLDALVTLCDLSEGSVIAKIDNKEVTFPLKAGGTYNAQNAIAACAVAKVIGIDTDDIIKAISEVKPAFGRGEVINIAGKKIILQLVKNPAGFRHALISGKAVRNEATIIAINDDYADGRDVSWLWDVTFKGYIKSDNIITTGVRSADMALRLKYDDIKTIFIEPNLDISLNKGLNMIAKNDTLLVYATYTAMLKLRNILSKQTKVDFV